MLLKIHIKNNKCVSSFFFLLSLHQRCSLLASASNFFPIAFCLVIEKKKLNEWRCWIFAWENMLWHIHIHAHTHIHMHLWTHAVLFSKSLFYIAISLSLFLAFVSFFYLSISCSIWNLFVFIGCATMWNANENVLVWGRKGGRRYVIYGIYGSRWTIGMQTVCNDAASEREEGRSKYTKSIPNTIQWKKKLKISQKKS